MVRSLMVTPTPALRPFVRAVSYSPPSVAPTVRDLMVPDAAAISLWVNLHQDAFRSYDPAGTTEKVGPGAIVAGPTDRASIIEIESRRSHICVDFVPGAGGIFFDHGPEAFRNELVGLDAAWGSRGDSVRERILSSGSPRSMIRMTEAILLEHLTDHPDIDAAMLRASTLLERGIHVSEVADELGLTARTLLRRFTRSYGVTPKRYARVRRLRRVVDSIGAAPEVDWAATAAQHGYADQAHLIDDFRDLVGITPGFYLENRGAAPTHVST